MVGEVIGMAGGRLEAILGGDLTTRRHGGTMRETAVAVREATVGSGRSRMADSVEHLRVAPAERC